MNRNSVTDYFFYTISDDFLYYFMLYVYMLYYYLNRKRREVKSGARAYLALGAGIFISPDLTFHLLKRVSTTHLIVHRSLALAWSMWNIPIFLRCIIFYYNVSKLLQGVRRSWGVFRKEWRRDDRGSHRSWFVWRIRRFISRDDETILS